MEEEIVRLEEQIVHCRQELYQEASFTSSSKTNSADLPRHWQSKSHMVGKAKLVSSNAKESESPLSRKQLSASGEILRF